MAATRQLSRRYTYVHGHYPVLSNVISSNVNWYNVIWYNMNWYNVIWYNTNFV
jgi:hypothetical protein